MVNLYNQDYPDRKHPFLFKKIFKKLSDVFHEESLKSIKEDTSKLRTYALFKSDIGLEPYLENEDKWGQKSLNSDYLIITWELKQEDMKKSTKKSDFVHFAQRKWKMKNIFYSSAPFIAILDKSTYLI